MDAGSIAEITQLPQDKVRSVLRSCNNDQSEIERAINLYLEGGIGPFKDASADSGGAWAESGKTRRTKKVRCISPRRAPWPAHDQTRAHAHLLITRVCLLPRRRAGGGDGRRQG